MTEADAGELVAVPPVQDVDVIVVAQNVEIGPARDRPGGADSAEPRAPSLPAAPEAQAANRAVGRSEVHPSVMKDGG